MMRYVSLLRNSKNQEQNVSAGKEIYIQSFEKRLRWPNVFGQCIKSALLGCAVVQKKLL